jgi:hypothetical protein
VHASIWHVEGPKSGPKSVYVVAVPQSKHNSSRYNEIIGGVLLLMPRMYTAVERAIRLTNSVQFDKASYDADGGDEWIDDRRREFFSAPMGVDQKLWAKAVQASKDCFGGENWKFTTWWYKKQGGRFS